MLGVLINTVAVILGSGIGMMCKKGIPEKMADAVMKMLGAFVMCTGIIVALVH